MSLSQPSQVSATTGSDHQYPLASGGPWAMRQALPASRTTPTLCVLVIITGPSRKPDSSTQVVPVISPLPFCAYQPAKEKRCMDAAPRGSTAVTPVRTGPLPTSSLPLPEMSVVWPTSTPPTSVIALSGPGVPSKGTPRSRARGRAFIACGAAPALVPAPLAIEASSTSARQAVIRRDTMNPGSVWPGWDQSTIVLPTGQPHENRHLQRQRHQRTAPEPAALARGELPRHRVPAGAQDAAGEISRGRHPHGGLRRHLARPEELERGGDPRARAGPARDPARAPR